VLLASGAFDSAGAADAAAAAAAATAAAAAQLPGSPAGSGGGGSRPRTPSGAADAAVPAVPAASIELACDGPAFGEWLCSAAVGRALATLLLEDLPGSPRCSGGDGGGAPHALPDGKAMAQDDAAREARCQVAMEAVQRFEAACPVDLTVGSAECIALNKTLQS
jgi:hypothetical protein